MKICLIDNYDSFTYNLEHQLRSFDLVVDVVANDQVRSMLSPDYEQDKNYEAEIGFTSRRLNDNKLYRKVI